MKKTSSNKFYEYLLDFLVVSFDFTFIIGFGYFFSGNKRCFLMFLIGSIIALMMTLVCIKINKSNVEDVVEK